MPEQDVLPLEDETGEGLSEKPAEISQKDLDALTEENAALGTKPVSHHVCNAVI